jgi:ABC-2 type transport system ATP-binding protein
MTDVIDSGARTPLHRSRTALQRRRRTADAHPMTSENMIDCTDLRCAYGSFEAVHGIDLTVRRGELLALLGTNGAGKTSTLEVLRGHRRAAAGTVRVLGLDPAAHRRELARRIGVVPQDSGFAPALTVAETLRLWTRLGGHELSTAGAAVLLRRSRLEHRAGVPLRQLSGGERRRLDLAIALAGDPPLLMLDEPTTGLDPESREHTWALIRQRLDDGVTVLLTTHYLEEAEALADRLAVMDRGRIAVVGTPEEVTAGRPARIRGIVPSRLRQEALPALAGRATWASLGPNGVELTVSTYRLQADLALLTGWAAAHGAELGRLTATPATLADVFHHLTNDSAAEAGVR